jgi:hypothetical protein
MDSSTSGALGIISLLLTGAGLVYTAINHKRIRCKLCGRDVDISMDIDSTEPTAAPAAHATAHATAPATAPATESESEPEPEPIIVLPNKFKIRRSSLPPIIKKPRSRQIMPTPEEE